MDKPGERTPEGQPGEPMSDTEPHTETETQAAPLGPVRKVGLALLVLYDYLRVRVGLRRRPLPEVVRRLRCPPRLRIRRLEPRRLGSIVDRVLSVGPLRPRCLVTALVHYRLLRRQGTAAELVVGLPPTPTGPDAHAWIEVDRREVGPPPGRLGHKEMARYGG